jgi:hypothetical protein
VQAGDDDADKADVAAVACGRDAADDKGLQVVGRDVRADGSGSLRSLQEFGEGGVQGGAGAGPRVSSAPKHTARPGWWMPSGRTSIATGHGGQASGDPPTPTARRASAATNHDGADRHQHRRSGSCP